MAKKSSTLPLNLREPPARMPLYRWLYEELRSAILAGRLRPGSRLPATRDLAAEYKLSRPTIVTAFDQLRSEGYVEGRTGSGTYVSEVLPEDFLQAPRADARAKAPRRKIRLSAYARRLHPLHRTESRSARAFRASKPALDEFPAALWAKVAARRLRRVSANLLAGEGGMGYRPLREAVAEYLNTSRGVKCSADQVLIISGVQEALERAAHLLLDRDDRVWLEEPGYPGAAIVFWAVGGKICSVPVDAEGLDVERGEERWPGPKLIYTTPAHQFPLGMTMSLRRRLALLDSARRSHSLIFEDDYDSEYRYSGRPVPALQGLDRTGSVIYAGSFNEVLFPALRLAYLVVPTNMVDRFAAAQSIGMRYAPLLDQAVLCDFIQEGHLGRHLRRMRELYAERLAALIELTRENLAGLLEISSVEAGLQTVAWLARGLNAERAARRAAQRDVGVIPPN